MKCDNFVGIEKISLVDFDDKVSCTLFTFGCNFRCPFCHNSSLVVGEDNSGLDFDEILNYLKSRKGIIDAVVITGGEPTIMPALKEKIRAIKKLGFLVKLDTNGTNPIVLKKLIEEGLIDYVAMDIKNSPQKYNNTCGLNNIDLGNINNSIEYLLENHVDYEFRTTLVKEFHELKDVEEIGKWIKGAKRYRLQRFIDNDHCIKPNLREIEIKKAQEYRTILQKYIDDVELRSY